MDRETEAQKGWSPRSHSQELVELGLTLQQSGSRVQAPNYDTVHLFKHSFIQQALTQHLPSDLLRKCSKEKPSKGIRTAGCRRGRSQTRVWFQARPLPQPDAVSAVALPRQGSRAFILLHQSLSYRSLCWGCRLPDSSSSPHVWVKRL